jgi:GNAT superfamily N-acetyltransferase
MEIRQYAAKDAPALEHLLRAVWGSEPQALRYYRFGERCLRTVVAVEHGQPVGFGSAWTNSFHPHALYVGVNVHPARRRQGIGSRLLEAVAGAGAPGLPLQGCTWETSAEGVRFALRHGFAEVRRTWEPVLRLADVDVAALACFEERCRTAGYRLASLAELPQGPREQIGLRLVTRHKKQMTELLTEMYTATHTINPPLPMDFVGWFDILRDGPPDNAASFVAFQDEQVIAMSLAECDEPDAPNLMWCGVKASHRQHERDLMLALAVRQIAHMAGRGATQLQAEFDSTDPWAMLLMGALPFGPAPSWVTFQRRR